MQDPFTLEEIVKVLITAFLPYLELRAAIPLALYFGARPVEAFIVGALGNLVPIIPIMLVMPLLVRWADRLPLFHRLFFWIERRTEKQQRTVNKYGFIGFANVFGYPFAMDGGWNGAICGYLLGVSKALGFFCFDVGSGLRWRFSNIN